MSRGLTGRVTPVGGEGESHGGGILVVTLNTGRNRIDDLAREPSPPTTIMWKASGVTIHDPLFSTDVIGDLVDLEGRAQRPGGDGPWTGAGTFSGTYMGDPVTLEMTIQGGGITQFDGAPWVTLFGFAAVRHMGTTYRRCYFTQSWWRDSGVLSYRLILYHPWAPSVDWRLGGPDGVQGELLIE